MKNIFIFIWLFLGVTFSFAQNVGINQLSPSNSLHVSPVNLGDNPLRIDGLQAYSIGDTSLLMINAQTGIVKYINSTDFVNLISITTGLGTDNQHIDSMILNGLTLSAFIEEGGFSSVDLSPIVDSSVVQILNDATFNQNIISILHDNADTLLYNSSFITSLKDSIDTDVDSVVLVGTTLTIYENGNGAFVDLSTLSDGDSDATNEIQDLNLNGNDLTITNNGSASTIDLSSYLDNTDAQTLTLNGNNLSISNGNSVTLTDNINDADSNSLNEIQDLNLNGNNLSITNNSSASTIDLSSYLDNTDAQTLTLSGNNLSISNGNSVTLTDNVNDADSNPSNEYNTGFSLNPANRNLSITDNGSSKTVSLNPVIDSYVFYRHVFMPSVGQYLANLSWVKIVTNGTNGQIDVTNTSGGAATLIYSVNNGAPVSLGMSNGSTVTINVPYRQLLNIVFAPGGLVRYLSFDGANTGQGHIKGELIYHQ